MGQPTKNLKKLIRWLKQGNKCLINKNQIQYEKIKSANLLVLAAPILEFDEGEVKAIQKFLSVGGCVFFMSQEGLFSSVYDSYNSLISQYGVQFNKNSVMRTQMLKYFHPKEVLISHGVVQQDLVRCSMGSEQTCQPIHLENEEENLIEDSNFQALQGISIVYPFGCSLKVENQATALFCSGPASYPHNECIFASFQNQNGGQLLVLGSWQVFSDDYFDLEENQRLFQFVLNQIGNQKVQRIKIDKSVKQDEHFSKQKTSPFVEDFAEEIKGSYIQNEDFTRDFQERFDFSVQEKETDFLPEIIGAFEQMKIKQEPLKLIAPLFETPLLGLSPAVFPPILLECDAPNLELFDLDEEFCDSETKLAVLTNKCTNEDLEHYVLEAAKIMQIDSSVNTNSPNKVILHIFEKVMQYKYGQFDN